MANVKLLSTSIIGIALLVIGFVAISCDSCLWNREPSGEVLRSYNGLEARIHRTGNLIPHYWHEGKLYGSRGLDIYKSPDFGVTWERVAFLGKVHDDLIPKLRHYVGRMRPVAGLLGRDVQVSDVRILADGTVLASYRARLFSGDLIDGEVVELENTASISASFMHHGWTEDHKGVVLIGQYQAAESSHGIYHQETGLFCSFDSGKSLETCATFPREQIRHIHAVQFDPYTNRTYVLTGDYDHEPAIMTTNDYGRNFTTLGSGSQQWRAVSIIFTSEHIYWGMDSQKDNQLFRYNRSTAQLDELLVVQNPFYYSASDNDGNLFFSTAVEDPVSQPHSSWCADLWVLSKLEATPRRIGRWRKKPVRPHGMLAFAQGTAPAGWVALRGYRLQGLSDDDTVVLKTDPLPHRNITDKECDASGSP